MASITRSAVQAECSCSYAVCSRPVSRGPRQPRQRNSGLSGLPTHRRQLDLSRVAAFAGRVADETYLKEYAALKDTLQGNTRKAGGGLAAYLLLTVDGVGALCALMGAAFANIYLLALFRDVDNLGPNAKVAMREADKLEQPTLRAAARVAAAYSHALTPRLLVPIGLGASMWAWNQFSGLPLDTVHEGCILLGFLAYKVPLVLKIADDNMPKAYKGDEMSRPTIERFDDELDQWGRPKKQLVPLPTEVPLPTLPEGVESKLPSVDLSLVDLNAIRTKGLGGVAEIVKNAAAAAQASASSTPPRK